MVKVTINDMFIKYIDAEDGENWIRDRWKIVDLPEVHEEIKKLNAEVTGIDFHPRERYLNIHANEK